MKVGYLTASVSRQAGGLATSVRQEAKAVSARGPEVKVFAVDDSDTATDLAEWEPLPVHISPLFGPARFSYGSTLGRALGESGLDVLVSHGLWRYTSVAAARWHARYRKPYLVNPHGMLDAWALRNSSWKKRIASALFERRHLREASCLRALCNAELDAIREIGLTNPVAVIPNGVVPPPQISPSLPPAWEKLPGFGQARIALSLGRLHPKKNLPALLQAWRSATEDAPDGARWRLVIAGWDEGGHEAELKRYAAELLLEDRVTFCGPLYGAEKDSAYRSASAFIIPSLSEGLPMVVLEAWSYGLPVLMTKECNLPEGFATGAAIDVGIGSSSIGEGLTTLFSMNDGERAAMGNIGRELTRQRFSWDQVASEIVGVLSWLTGEGARPHTVED